MIPNSVSITLGVTGITDDVYWPDDHRDFGISPCSQEHLTQDLGTPCCLKCLSLGFVFF